ncbi:hypothetical protein DB88DRAFT_513192 [Papiliotrema laurentii]|uniref:Uncharacterized protein n=1 Tax=Papiliotrema laurentii TaxID=5418 RepID=A0AAD9CV32_PAPLA|nr:hypothetical protein DB88DRAFT_513192 [Papiliotrema laurentii]
MVWKALVNAPNRVMAKQIAVQNEKVPTYMKGNHKYYYRAYLGLFAVSFGLSQWHLFQYVTGKTKAGGA